MPITELSHSAPRIGGRLRLGKRVGKRPVATDHFIFDPENPSLREPFVRLYGEQPTVVDVALAEDVIVMADATSIDLDQSTEQTINRVFPQWRRFWRSGGLFCQGDSHSARRKMDGGGWQTVACGDECPFWQQDPVQCRYEGNLTFLLWRLPTIDFFQVTARARSIRNINGFIRTMINLRGQAAKVPLKLSMAPYRTQRGTTAYELILSLADQAPVKPLDALAEPALSNALPPAGELPAPDDPMAVLAKWELGPADHLHDDPYLARQVRDHINLIRRHVLPSLTGEPQQEMARVLMGQSDDWPRTPELLERILSKYLGPIPEGGGRRVGGLLRPEEREQ